MIRYIVVDRSLYRLRSELEPSYMPDTHGVLYALGYIQWFNRACEYDKLTPAEKHEMFDLRLRNYPQLRREAGGILGRNIARSGFGFYVGGYNVDGYSDDQGDAEARRLFRSELRRHNFEQCTREER